MFLHLGRFRGSIYLLLLHIIIKKSRSVSMMNGSGSEIKFLNGLNIINIKKNNIHNHYVALII